MKTSFLAQSFKSKGKKSSLVFGNRLGEFFFYHSPARIVEIVSEYIFNTKAKETKEEKRISPEKSIKK